ncbi:hypothetical protein HHI36_009989 [Cryptolaemus montrouzieri]|uniref:Uncharacterized protein n=1 Tax=Cryptolaemus montrouzieri TaxID=559131 RepID=A0ABD2MHE1_9CUCU
MFIKVNMSKRQRVIDNYLHYRSINRRRDEDIEKITADLEVMKDVYRKIKSVIEKFEDKYESYLKSVIKKSLKFNKIYDILHHYDELINARQLTNQKRNQLFNVTGWIQEHFRNITFHEVIVFKNLLMRIDGLLNKYADSNRRSQKAELLPIDVVDRIDQFRLEIERTLSSIHMLYLLICRRANIEPIFEKNDFDHKLSYIKRTFATMNEIIKKSEIENSNNEQLKVLP